LVDLAGNALQRLVAAASVRGRGLGDRVSGSDPAGGGGVPEGGDLGRFDALGKLGAVCHGAVWAQGVRSRLGPGGADGGIGRVAAGEEAGEEAGEAQGGYFKEVASGARGWQKGHELGSKALHE
jgi:hypothetical protein